MKNVQTQSAPKSNNAILASMGKTAPKKPSANTAPKKPSANTAPKKPSVKTAPKKPSAKPADTTADKIGVALVAFQTAVQSGATVKETAFDALDVLRARMAIPKKITPEFKPDYMGILADLMDKEKSYLKGCSGLSMPATAEYSVHEFKMYRYGYNLIREWFKIRGLIVAKPRAPQQSMGENEGQNPENPSPQTARAPLDVVGGVVDTLKELEDCELLAPSIRDAIVALSVAYSTAKNKAKK